MLFLAILLLRITGVYSIWFSCDQESADGGPLPTISSAGRAEHHQALEGSWQYSQKRMHIAHTFLCGPSNTQKCIKGAFFVKELLCKESKYPTQHNPSFLHWNSIKRNPLPLWSGSFKQKRNSRLLFKPNCGKKKVSPCNGAVPALHRLTARFCLRDWERRFTHLILRSSQHKTSPTPLRYSSTELWIVPNVIKTRTGSIDQEQSTAGPWGRSVF